MSICISFDPENLRQKFDAGSEAFDVFFGLFKKNYPDRIGKMGDLIAKDAECNQMYNIAHTIKGSVTYYRLDSLTKVCVSMETAIKTEKIESIRKEYTVYKANLDYFISEVEKHLAGL